MRSYFSLECKNKNYVNIIKGHEEHIMKSEFKPNLKEDEELLAKEEFRKFYENDQVYKWHRGGLP